MFLSMVLYGPDQASKDGPVPHGHEIIFAQAPAATLDVGVLSWEASQELAKSNPAFSVECQFANWDRIIEPFVK